MSPQDRSEPIPIPKGDKIAAAQTPLPPELLPPRCIPHEILGDICYRLEDDSWRWIAGEERGEELLAVDVQQRLKRFLKEVENQQLEPLVQEFAEDENFSLSDFASSAISIMVSAHAIASAIPHGGKDKLGPREWERIRETAKHYVNAPSETQEGKRYGLRWLFADLKAGKLSPRMLLYRLKGYVASAMTSFWREVRADAGKQEKLYAFRTLGDKKHCPSCIRHYRLGIRPAAEIPLPGTQCECGPRNCDCSIFYISATEKARIETGAKTGRTYSLGGTPFMDISS